MIITIIIIGYIASVFLCRWLSKILYQIDQTDPKFAGISFIPIVNIILIFALIMMILTEYKSKNKFVKWFRGDHW